MSQPTITTETITALAAHARELGLSEEDLDETIYEITNEDASVAFNAAEGEYDELHDDADGLASQVNNEGLERQLEVIALAYGLEATRKLLDDMAS